MSNIAANANRYNTSNTFRSDTAANTRGSARNSTGTAIGFDCSGLVYHVLRESGYNVPYAASSVMVDDKTFNGNWATPVKREVAVQPGTLAYFNGHVGIVQSYDPVTKRGEFLSMTGSNNSGVLKPTEAFTTDRDANPKIHWGGTTAFKGFAEVKPELYDRTLDQHANGANPNTPVFNIPEASNAGFVTLPNNGGFPAPKSARDLSADVGIIAASTGIAPPAPIDLPNANTAFATALAALESNGQPNNGYGAWLQDGQGIGAIGRYGFRAPSLKAIGWMDSKGSWTDEARANGVDSPESFRDNPQAQEAARVEYMSKIKSELQANGAWAMIGKTVDGHVVTEAGLLAAAWKEGTGAVDKFFEGNSNNTNANTNILFRLDRFAQAALPAGGAVDAPTNPSIPTESPRTPYPNNSTTVHHENGDTTVNFTAKGDSSDGSIRKGDLVTYVQDADGKTTYFSVNHQEGNETTLQERVVDPVTGEITITYSQWVGSGPGSLQFQGQWDAAGNRVGDYYVQGGETYARTADGAGTTRWLNDRGQTRQEWLADPENPHSANAVNGSDLQSDLDSGLPEQHVLSDFGKALIDAFENSRTSSGGDGTQYAEAGTGTDTATDAGGGGNPEPNPNHQSDTHLHLADIPAPELANHFAGGNAGGAYGAGQLGGFDILPFNDTSSFLVNEDGDITGEINLLSNGYHQVKNLYGDAVYVAPSGAVLSANNYQEAQDKVQAQQIQDATTSLGLTQSILGLKHWEDMSDLGKISALTNIYNSVDKLNGNSLPGELGGVVGALGLLNALEQGNAGGALYSGLSLVENLTSVSGVANSGWVSLNMPGGANFLPGLNLVLALDSGDPMATMAAAAAFIPVYGPLISAVISIFGGLFGDDDPPPPPPPPEGEVHFGWNAQGQIATELDRNQSGGGDSAQSIAGNLQTLLQNIVQQHNSRNPGADDDLALNPYLIPRVGVSGGSPWLEVHLPNGQTIRETINGETIAERLLHILQGNGGLAPAWQVETIRQHWLADQAELATLQGQLSQAEARLPRSAPDNENNYGFGFGNGGDQLITSVQPVYRHVGYDGEQDKWELVGDNSADVAAYEAAVQAIAAKQAQIARALHAGEDGGIDASHPGGQAWALQGNAVEAPDFKSQHYGALVVHAQASLNQTLGDIKISQALRDAENDGYLEQTDWIAASDAQGQAQGLLVLDFSGNGVIETRDILNLGGNADPTGANPTDEARLASQNADLQRNNIGWLDGNGDHVLDARDPAFAAIKLWVDANQDAVMQSGEGQSLTARGISSINFSTGQVSYTDGHTDALSATTLKADTEGFKLTQMFTGTAGEFSRMQAAAARGDSATAQYIADAHNGGAMVEHEGYQGKQLISDAAGSRWVADREQSYEHDALRTGDWEGTAAQEAHRHGGGNVAGSATETTATGSSDFGTVEGRDTVVTHSEVKAGDGRITSDVPTVNAPPSSPNATTVIGAGDNRIESAQPAAVPASSTPSTNVEPEFVPIVVTAPAPSAQRQVTAGSVQSVRPAAASSTSSTPPTPSNPTIFVPLGATSVQSEQRQVTAQMLESAQGALFGTGLLATVVAGMGSAQAGQAEAVNPVAQGSDNALFVAPLDSLPDSPFTLSPSQGDVDRLSPSGNNTSTGHDENLASVATVSISSIANAGTTTTPAATTTVFRQVDLGSFQSYTSAPPAVPTEAARAELFATLIVSDTFTANNTKATDATANPATVITLGYPVVLGETLAGAEDIVLRLPSHLLLANDSTPNQAANPDQALLTITAVAQPSHGQVALQSRVDEQGQTVVDVVFVPDVNFHGTASFSYTVTDQYGLARTGTATLEIASVNDTPVASGEMAQTDEDVGLVFTQAQLLTNDSDVDIATDGDSLHVSRVGDAQHGLAWLDAAGQVRFVPDANYHGPAQFSYWVADSAGAEALATIHITVVAVNDVPVLTGETVQSDEDRALVFDPATLLVNDSDADTLTDGQILSVSTVGSATHGTVALVAQADGSQRIVFTPDANYFGVASYQYTVVDGVGGVATTTVMLNLAQVNDVPVGVDDVLPDTAEDTALHISFAQLLGNDTDADAHDADWGGVNEVLSVSAVGDAVHGTVTIVDGEVVFTPEANYHGPAQFSYRVTDSAGAETMATARIVVAAINDVPVVTGEIVHNDEDVTLVFDPALLLANDSDVDTLTDGQVLSISAVGSATHGTVALVTQADGSPRIVFTPETDYFGTASYQYTVSDGAGGTATATVILNLAEIDDVPVGVDDVLPDTAEDTALHISFAQLLGNDTDADAHNADWGGVDEVLSVSAVGHATHGSVAIVDGEVVFTPEANYHGSASFTYQVRDASGALGQAIATFNILAVNDAPVAVSETLSADEDSTLLINPAALLQNDSDVDTPTDGQLLGISAVFNAQHGQVSVLQDGTVQFVPEPDFFGTASFDYTVSDGNGGTAVATATIELANVNDAPVATGETLDGVEDQSLTIAAGALLQNDSDIDSASSELRISRVQSVAGGVATLNANGDVVFTPTTDLAGTARFSYWVCDANGLESGAVTTTVLLSAVNDAPYAQGDVVTGASEDAVFHIDRATLLANDGDVDDATTALSLGWVGNAAHGTVSLDASGNVVFTPLPDFNGNATFQYRTRDPQGVESPTVQVVIPVAAVNDVPVAVDDQFQTYRNSQMSISFGQLKGNDRDVDGDALTVSQVANAQGGTAWIDRSTVRFTPAADFTGTASFEYLADDQHGGQAWATAFVQVRPPPNQYPTMTMNSGVAWYLGSYSSVQYGNHSFTLRDDGDPGAVQVYFGGASVTVNGAGSALSQGDAGASLNAPAGVFSWDVRNWTGGPGYTNQISITWQLVDDRGLSNRVTWSLDSASWNGIQYTFTQTQEHSGYYFPPIVLDLNGDGVHFTSVSDSRVRWDVNFDGLADPMAWAGKDDGVLVWDKDHNAQITDASEFGFHKLTDGAQTDLEGLRALDSNQNGQLDAGDAKFAEFGVFQDANGNGITDAGEFKSLAELGIVQIALQSDGQMRDVGDDVTVMGQTTFMRSDGSTGVTADAMLAYRPAQAPADIPVGTYASAQADAQDAQLMRMALLFNQMVNTADSGAHEPLGFVPIAPDTQWHDIALMAEQHAQPQAQAA